MSEAQMRRISYLRSIVKDRDAEIERLRAALETISLMDKKHEHDLFSATQVARAALDGQPAPGKEDC